jgi:hypothetical protein
MTSKNPKQQHLNGIPKPSKRDFQYGLKMLAEIAEILGVKGYK